MIHHITYHVPEGTLGKIGLADFFKLIGMEEIPADDKFEHGWNVRWFRDINNSRALPVHLIETDDGEQDNLALGHFCVEGWQGADIHRMTKTAQRRSWLERDSGSGRIWLRFANLRVEVRP